MIKISNLLIPLIYDIKMIQDIVSKKLGVDYERIEQIIITKRSVNATDKNNICFCITLSVCVKGDENQILRSLRDKSLSKEIEMFYSIPKERKFKQRPIVIGFGPAGIFAGLILAEAGARPIIMERGLDVDSRKQKVLTFWKTGILSLQTNVQFGEGGAGAFSDGKLKIGSKDFRKMKVLSELVEAGAPSEIMFLSKPHIGTDCLHDTVKQIREKIINLGGEVRFNVNVSELLHKNGQVVGIKYIENGKIEIQNADNVILAIGNSARDTFESLYNSGIVMEQKPLAVGVRIEHTQDMIDKIQYGNFAGNPILGAADYKMVVHLKNGRAVYTFCNCPGGTVVAATSEKNAVVTNGMSEYARDGKNANSALLVTIDKKDFGSEHPFAGVLFQQKIEAAAFVAGGGGYSAPVQRLEDFMQKKNTKAFGDVLPTYLPRTEFSQIDSYLPDYVANSLRQGIIEMGEWMPGFAYPDAILTGAETRSSSPVRICRGETFEAIGIKGLYPCGEGGGYSGGIISAAIDGVLCAEKVLAD